MDNAEFKAISLDEESLEFCKFQISVQSMNLTEKAPFLQQANKKCSQ